MDEFIIFPVSATSSAGPQENHEAPASSNSLAPPSTYATSEQFEIPDLDFLRLSTPDFRDMGAALTDFVGEQPPLDFFGPDLLRGFDSFWEQERQSILDTQGWDIDSHFGALVQTHAGPTPAVDTANQTIDTAAMDIDTAVEIGTVEYLSPQEVAEVAMPWGPTQCFVPMSLNKSSFACAAEANNPVFIPTPAQFSASTDALTPFMEAPDSAEVIGPLAQYTEHEVDYASQQPWEDGEEAVEPVSATPPPTPPELAERETLRQMEREIEREMEEIQPETQPETQPEIEPEIEQNVVFLSVRPSASFLKHLSSRKGAAYVRPGNNYTYGLIGTRLSGNAQISIGNAHNGNSHLTGRVHKNSTPRTRVLPLAIAAAVQHRLAAQQRAQQQGVVTHQRVEQISQQISQPVSQQVPHSVSQPPEQHPRKRVSASKPKEGSSADQEGQKKKRVCKPKPRLELDYPLSKIPYVGECPPLFQNNVVMPDPGTTRHLIQRVRLFEGAERAKLSRIFRTKYYRDIEAFRNLGHHNVRYEPNKNNEPYLYQIARVEIRNGVLHQDTRSALCPFCEEISFFELKNSCYAQHMSHLHGVCTDSYMIPNPIFVGRYNVLKDSNPNRRTVARVREHDAAVCPVCYKVVEIRCWASTRETKPLSNYLRHFKENHHIDGTGPRFFEGYAP